MKANANKRKIFDAVDLLTEDTSAQTTAVKAENGIEQIAIDSIKAFHNYPFHLYVGERLNDMVESIREHGILNPIIVLKMDDGYEMLSGHNRANAAKIAGLSEVPAIIKVGLSESEAYVYVIETNLIQRSFAELLPSEKAAVMAAHYDKVCCQGKRNDIIRELQILSGIEPEETSCHNGKKLNSLDVIASEYGFSSRNAISWATDIKEYALQQALSGIHYEGFKVVEGRANRKYTDDEAVAFAAKDAGFDPYEKKLLGITAMTVLMGKKKFEEVLGKYITKPQGKPALVPESDKRPAINTAFEDFSEN